MGTAGGAQSVWLPSVCQISHCSFFTAFLTSKINLELGGKEASLLAFFPDLFETTLLSQLV